MALHMPPSGFVSRIKGYDKELRVRWSDVHGAWRIERRIRAPRINLDPGLFADPEDFTTAAEGYALIMRVPQNMLDNRVFELLWAGDLQRRGGGAKVDQEDLDAYNERLEKAMNAWGDEIEQAALERCKYLNTIRTVSERNVHTAPADGMSING